MRPMKARRHPLQKWKSSTMPQVPEEELDVFILSATGAVLREFMAEGDVYLLVYILNAPGAVLRELLVDEDVRLFKRLQLPLLLPFQRLDPLLLPLLLPLPLLQQEVH